MTVETVDWMALPNASDHLKWNENKGMLKLWFFCSIMFTAQFLCGYDGSVTWGMLALDSWHEDLGFPSTSTIGLMNITGPICGVLSGPMVAFIADRWGRKWALRIWGFLVVSSTTLAVIAGSVGSSSLGVYITSRALIGIGFVFQTMTCQIMMQEITHPRNRAMVAALNDCGWILGSLIASWVAFGCSYLDNSWSWRIPFMVALPFAFYMLIAIQFVPESPRFLLSQGKVHEARQFFIDYHGNGNPEDEMVKAEIAEVEATLEAEKGLTDVSWKAMLSDKINRRRFLLAMLMTFLPQLNGQAIIQAYYSVMLGLVGITGASKVTGIGAGINVFSLICEVIGSWAVTRCRRRVMVLTIWPLLLLFMVGIATSTAIFTNSGQTNTAAGLACVVFVWLFSGANNSLGPLFYSYPAEILNFAIRAKGMTAWNTANQACNVFSNYTNSVALAAIGWKYYTVYFVVIVAQWILAYLFMVETKGLSLEQVTLLFENEESSVSKTIRQVDQEALHKIHRSSSGEKSEDEKSGMAQVSVLPLA